MFFFYWSAPTQKLKIVMCRVLPKNEKETQVLNASIIECSDCLPENEDDQSILIKELSCQPSVLFRTNTTQKTFTCAGLYVLFLKGQGHKGIFSLVKGTLWGHCIVISTEDFKGTKTMTRGHGGNPLRCLLEESGFLLKLIRAPRQWPVGMEAIPSVAPLKNQALVTLF